MAQENISQVIKYKKVIKRKGNTLYVKRKGYYNCSNSWINKKDKV